MLQDDLDRGRAVVFARHLADLTPEQISRICRALLPVAPGLTTGQLADRIKRMILEIDPDYYDARYRKALRDRQVVHYLDRDGAAVVTASGLPADEAAAAMRRVDDLARAARRAGCRGTLDQVRADVFLALLDGSVHGMSRTEIIGALIDRAAGGHPSDPVPSAAAGPGPGSAAPGTDDVGAGADGAGPACPGAGSVEHVPDDPGHPRTAGPAPAGPAPAGPAPAGPGESGSVDVGGGGAVRGPGGSVADQRVGIEIRVPLITLLGESERAGEIPGLGPVTAATARGAVARARRAQWRWVVVDTSGRLLTEGVTRRRPADLDRRGPRSGLVELQVSEADLLRIAADPARGGPWADVVADLAAQHHRHRQPQRAVDLDARPGSRFPVAALRRHVQIRDRTCCHPGCRAPATGTDIDHTLDHAAGGPTVRAGLGPACRHDHMLKTVGGWICHQPAPGHFVWTSPLGRTYDVQPEPILPPPVTAAPRDPDPHHDEPARDSDRPLVADPATPRAPPQPPSPPEPRRRPRYPGRDPFTLIDGSPEHTDPPPF